MNFEGQFWQDYDDESETPEFIRSSQQRSQQSTSASKGKGNVQPGAKGKGASKGKGSIQPGAKGKGASKGKGSIPSSSLPEVPLPPGPPSRTQSKGKGNGQPGILSPPPIPSLIPASLPEVPLPPQAPVRVQSGSSISILRPPSQVSQPPPPPSALAAAAAAAALDDDNATYDDSSQAPIASAAASQDDQIEFEPLTSEDQVQVQINIQKYWNSGQAPEQNVSPPNETDEDTFQRYVRHARLWLDECVVQLIAEQQDEKKLEWVDPNHTEMTLTDFYTSGSRRRMRKFIRYVLDKGLLSRLKPTKKIGFRKNFLPALLYMLASCGLNHICAWKKRPKQLPLEDPEDNDGRVMWEIGVPSQRVDEFRRFVNLLHVTAFNNGRFATGPAAIRAFESRLNNYGIQWYLTTQNDLILYHPDIQQNRLVYLLAQQRVMTTYSEKRMKRETQYKDLQTRLSNRGVESQRPAHPPFKRGKAVYANRRYIRYLYEIYKRNFNGAPPGVRYGMSDEDTMAMFSGVRIPASSLRVLEDVPQSMYGEGAIPQSPPQIDYSDDNFGADIGFEGIDLTNFPAFASGNSRRRRKQTRRSK